jgi:hypothetical protein
VTRFSYVRSIDETPSAAGFFRSLERNNGPALYNIYFRTFPMIFLNLFSHYRMYQRDKMHIDHH